MIPVFFVLAVLLIALCLVMDVVVERRKRQKLEREYFQREYADKWETWR